MNFFRKLREGIEDRNRSIKERLFITLTYSSVAVVCIALLGDILYRENIVEIITLILAVIVVPIITFFSVRNGKVELGTQVVSFGVIFLAMPVVYFFGGGPQGASPAWLVFTYLYIGLILSGKWRIGSLLTLTAVVIAMYSVGYFHPELIQYHSKPIFYLDSALAVIEVGFVCTAMTWFQNYISRSEEEKAKEETRKAEDLNRAQSRFFSSMSHEIRTPINSILGLNEIILRQEDASDEIVKDANNIQGAGKMLLALVNDILDISKIEAGKMDIVPVNYNLGSMISEIVNMMWLRAEEKNLELKIEVDPSIPAELFGDEVRVKQILVNLLNNAVKYTKEGSVTLHIEKEDIRGDQILLLFSVIDTGMGIKQDALPYLFDAFQRVDEEKNAKIEGTGLGLSIVKQLVELMDGKISVNSVYTQGSTFMVALWQKVTRKEAIGELNLKNYGRRESGKQYLPGFTAPDARVLIVDDNEMNLEVEKKLLAATDMRIDTALSGEEALAMTMAVRYDMILMDHLMPEMDGIECLQSIRKQNGGMNNHTPVVVLTANAGGENIDLYNRSGFDAYLVKPVSGAQLEETMLSHLPEVKVNRTEGTDSAKAQMNTARSYQKKIPVLITTSTMCDLPTEVLEHCQIDTIPFRILSEGKVYYDRVEADSDELMHYLNEGRDFDSEPPTVEEFENFFSREIKKAHQVLYFTLTTYVTEEYDRAKKAAQAYGNVHVIDSQVNGGAMGIMVLLAHRMASQGRGPEAIMAEMDRIREKLYCGFVTMDTEVLMRRKTMSRFGYAFLNTFSVRPIFRVKNNIVKVERLCVGDANACYLKYLETALPRRVKPDTDAILVDYVELTEEQKEMIEEWLRSKGHFEHILFQKASASMALNCGRGALGIFYLTRGDESYSLSNMLTSVLEEEEEAENPDVFLEEEPEEQPWYEGIPGLDPEAALENSGSEEGLSMVMRMFWESIPERAGEIEEYFGKEDWENYIIKVHALKSSLRIVGIMGLSDEAEALEVAGKAGNYDLIREKTGRLLSEYRRYLSILALHLPLDEDEQRISTGRGNGTE
ncbi:MAG: DegV family EDD domain-containing protein [Lachnospiraceae bacterium]|nr:DegV family EDD domain-containing protein [Lachnospiraceae bacterium]